MELHPDRLDPVASIVLLLQRSHADHDAAEIDAWTREEFFVATAGMTRGDRHLAGFVPRMVIEAVELRLRVARTNSASPTDPRRR